jgi:Na+/alanine symporter
MTVDVIAQTSEKRGAVLAIGMGGLIAGTLDLLQACILFGWDIPLVIAGGLLGRQAFHGGAGTYLLGVLLHFFIATSAAATYYAVSRKLVFLVEHPLICGLFFGGAVQEVMNLVVLPLSALHSRGPYKLNDLILGLVVHMIVIGLPIAYCARWFGKK